MDYSTQTDQNLVTLYNQYSTRLIDLQIEGGKEAAESTVVNYLTQINAELKRRADAEPPAQKFSSKSGASDPDSQFGKDMRACLDRVTVLAPGVNSTDFLASLENCYKNYVEGRPGLEARFVKYAITRMCDAYQTQIHGAENKLVTWAQLKTFVSDNYGVRLTPYQKLDKLFDLQVNSSDWTGYCVSLQNSADEVLRFVESKFKKSHPAEELGAKKLFDIVAVQIFLRRLQEGSDRGAYDYICGQLHDVWDLNSALALAKNFIDRRHSSDSPDSVSENSTFFGRGNQKPGKGENKGRNSQKQNKAEQKKAPESTEQGASRFKFTVATLGQASPKTCLLWANEGKCTRKKCHFEHKWNEPKKAPDAEKSGDAALFSVQGFY